MGPSLRGGSAVRGKCAGLTPSPAASCPPGDSTFLAAAVSVDSKAAPAAALTASSTPAAAAPSLRTDGITRQSSQHATHSRVAQPCAQLRCNESIPRRNARLAHPHNVAQLANRCNARVRQHTRRISHALQHASGAAQATAVCALVRRACASVAAIDARAVRNVVQLLRASRHVGGRSGEVQRVVGAFLSEMQ